MKITKNCPTCGKVIQVTSEIKVGSLRIMSYACGHSGTELGVSSAPEDTLDITSIDGKRPFPYQLEGGRFAEAANLRCLIADEMGLGKTIQAIMCIVAHPETRPFVWFGKSGLRAQYQKECVRWGDLMVQVVDGSNAPLLRGVDGYIIGYDTAWRIDDLAAKLASRGVKLAVLDECQAIKSTKAKRTKAIQDACRNMSHVIALSGTPIMNNAAEYFPVLNILRPDKFSNQKQFVYGWCDSFFNGYATKTGGLKSPKRFQDFTRDFIIRRERKDVLPDLPLIFRQYSFCDLGAMVEEAYKQAQKQFNDAFDESGGSLAPNEGGESLLGMMAKMRHLTGLAKIDPVCDFVEEFITTTDRKLAIFVHHKDVAETLRFKLERMQKEWPAEWGSSIAEIKSEMDTYERERQIEIFRSSSCRLMILSTLASGEGLNLQFCSDCVMMERQWNPAKEEQAEARFSRPGQLADKINATYFTAVGTIDEFLAELVEQKREICAKTMKGEAVAWSESGLMRELAAVLREKGGQRWGW